MKKITWIVILTLSTKFLNGQLIAPSLTTYEPGVVARVYDVFFATLISPEKQVKLAEIFTKQDAAFNNAVKAGHGLQKLKIITDSSEVMINRVLSAEERQKYALVKNKMLFENRSDLQVELLKKQYGIDTPLTKIFSTNRLAKEQSMSALDNTNKGGRDSALNKLIVIDSVYESYLVVAKGESFYNRQLKRMDSIKIVSPEDRAYLKKSYTTQCLTRGNNYHLNFNAAMQTCIKDSVYYRVLFEDSIQALAAVESKAEMQKYIYLYNLTKREIDKIRPVVDAKSLQDAWLRTRYQLNRKRDSLQDLNNETSWLKIKNILIREGFTYLDKKGRIVNAMKLNVQLKLRDGQMDSLSQKNLTLDLLTYNYKVNNRGADPDFSGVARAMIKEVLSTPQFDSLLLFELHPQALANTKRSWEQLKSKNLTTGLDSAKSFNEIFSYHMRTLLLTERYRDNPKSYAVLIKENKQRKPEILKKFDELNKNPDE